MDEYKLDQILKNQSTIMTFLHYGFNDIRTNEILGDALIRRNEETNKLLNLNNKENVKNRCKQALDRIESGDYVSEEEFFTKSEEVEHE